MNKVEQKLLNIVQHLVDKRYNLDIIVDLNTEISELGFDSLDLVELIMDIEEGFDIEIDDDYADEMSYSIKNVNEIKNILRDKYNILDIKAERKEKINNINK